MTSFTPLSLEKVSTYPLAERKSKVGVSQWGKSWSPGGGFKDWLDSLPGILAVEKVRAVTARVVQAVRSQNKVILAMGAHAIKVGLNPVIADLMERGIIGGLALNGAGIIHDAELAMVGQTSEDVDAELGKGKFGMAAETGEFLNAAVAEGAKQGMGLGQSIGVALRRENFPYNRFSLLAKAHELDIPATVHVALGTDIIHLHPGADGASIGQTSLLDFRIFARLISELQGGVYINLGSAVILPEVFLKALSLAHNLGYTVKDFTTVNMDFIRHYRPLTNVVHRPTVEGGQGFDLVGHHEIMFPLLAAAVIEGLAEDNSQKE
jgi:hypothetical protein